MAAILAVAALLQPPQRTQDADRLRHLRCARDPSTVADVAARGVRARSIPVALDGAERKPNHLDPMWEGLCFE